MNNLTLQMLGAFAEFERSMIKSRQRDGIDKALSKGIKFGAKPKFTIDEINEIKTKRVSGDSVDKISKEYGVSRQTIYTMLTK